MRLNHPVYAPVDIRVTLRIVAGMLVWKTLSSDFTSLIELARAPRPVDWGSSMQMEWVARGLTRGAEAVLVSADAVRGIQIGLCVALAAAVTVLNRWLMLAALIPVWAFHCYVSFFLGPIFANELYLCYLLLAVSWPGSWTDVVHGGREVRSGATTFGTAALAMVATWYFFAGLSKLVFDVNWVTSVRLEHLLPTFLIRNDVEPFWPSVANWIHQAFAAAPWLGTTAAAVVLASELLFPLALVSRWARLLLAPVMVGLHLLFFLSVGTLFLTSIVLLLAIVTPWRRLGRPDSVPRGTGDGRFLARGFAVLAALVGLHTACAVKNRNYFPAVNWAVFGWRYADMSAPVDIYRVGYRDPADGQIKLLPRGRGGFLDYRLVKYSNDLAATYFQANSDAERARACHRARNLLAGLRPIDSNRWLLGPFAHPDHSLTQAEPADVPPAAEFFFLKGWSRFADGGTVKEWDRIEPIEVRPSPGSEK